MDLIVREASIDDAQLIADLTRSAWLGKVAVTSSGHRETAVQVQEHLQQGGGFILVLGNEPAGSVRWLPLETQSDVWEIVRMGVLPRYRGQGLSQHLLEAVIHRAQEALVTEVRLAVRNDLLRLVDLYAAYDFEVAPELEYSHANPLEPPPIVMRRMLEH